MNLYAVVIFLYVKYLIRNTENKKQKILQMHCNYVFPDAFMSKIKPNNSCLQYDDSRDIHVFYTIKALHLQLLKPED